MLGYKLGWPASYEILGVPLISSRLKASDCSALVQRIFSKMKSRTNSALLVPLFFLKRSLKSWNRFSRLNCLAPFTTFGKRGMADSSITKQRCKCDCKDYCELCRRQTVSRSPQEGQKVHSSSKDHENFPHLFLLR